MMENNFYDGSVTAGIEPNTHFFQEVEVVYKPRKSLELSSEIRCSRDAFLYIKEFFKSFMSHHEEVWMILLNSCMQIIGSSQVSKGGLEHAFVDVRIIYQTALMAHATGFILVHNHPTGVLHPSKPDEELTKKIVGAGKILDIRLLDHLIISEDTYFSFADEGIILWMRWFVNKDLFLAYDTPYERLWNAKNWLHLFRC